VNHFHVYAPVIPKRSSGFIQDKMHIIFKLPFCLRIRASK